MAIVFVTDSGSDIPQTAEKIHVVPMTVSFGNEHFLDGVNLDHQTFYEKLTQSKDLPVTSQASPFAFAEVFQKIVDQGDTVICVTVSSKLSGTYQSACIAAKDFAKNVFVVDSLSVTVGQRALIDYGIQLADQGKTADEIVAILNEERNHLHIVALLDTLEYLKKGGRISSTTALAGTLLNLKPVVTVKDGAVALLGTAHGSKQGNNHLIKQIEKVGGIDFAKPYHLGYTGNSRDLLDRYIRHSEKLWVDYTDTLPVMTIGGAIGTHVGPGAIAFAFFSKDRDE